LLIRIALGYDFEMKHSCRQVGDFYKQEFAFTHHADVWIFMWNMN